MTRQVGDGVGIFLTARVLIKAGLSRVDFGYSTLSETVRALRRRCKNKLIVPEVAPEARYFGGAASGQLSA